MKCKTICVTGVMTGFLLVYGLGYLRASKNARSRRVVLAADTGDAPSKQGGHAGSEPYFDRRNPVPTRLW